MSGQEKRRMDHPEYVKLRDAVAAARPAAEAAKDALIALISESPYLLQRVAEDIAGAFPDDSEPALVAQEFLDVTPILRAAQRARLDWVDEHPEWR
ncbi:hypothetical protein [Pimelobacter simplex]|uniref:hypothetical protein n=1 Tax=Nocardioides simplex TaxID=2045 RepID=UPI003AAEBB44